jgi:hypothetical protein
MFLRMRISPKAKAAMEIFCGGDRPPLLDNTNGFAPCAVPAGLRKLPEEIRLPAVAAFSERWTAVFFERRTAV